jgi:hypothetical protein
MQHHAELVTSFQQAFLMAQVDMLMFDRSNNLQWSSQVYGNIGQQLGFIGL